MSGTWFPDDITDGAPISCICCGHRHTINGWLCSTCAQAGCTPIDPYPAPCG